MLSRFFHYFRWYLVLLALAAHLVLVVLLVAAFLSGPVRTLEYAISVARQSLAMVRSEAKSIETRREQRVEAMLGEALPDVFRFRAVPDATSESQGYGRVLQVGPGGDYSLPSQAARAARKGDRIEIAAGTYRGDSAVWVADDLLIRAVGGVARLDARGATLVQHKAIWIVSGDNVRIENIEFSYARSRDRNGAGIRAEGRHLRVVSCFFHDNESGLMASNEPDNSVVIEHSEFARNGHPSGQAHQIYIGSIASFELKFTYVHETIVGSAVKSRARESSILYNRIVDEPRGRSNYSIDLSAGGRAVVVGNVLQQGPATENYTLITYAPEGMIWDVNELFVVNNTLVSDRRDANFIYNHSGEIIHIYNNLMIGEAKPIEGTAILRGNLVDRRGGFLGGFDESLGGVLGSELNHYAADVHVVNRDAYDYRLQGGSPAIDIGVELDPTNSLDVFPEYEYSAPLSAVPREQAGPLDVGAFEYGS